MKLKNTCLLITLVCLSPMLWAANSLSLSQAIELAVSNDPWLQGNRLQQQATQASSIASGSMPDPTLSVGLMNLPTDSWEFDQENMTQLKVGVTQMFPRGDELSIKQSQLALQADSFPLQRENRKAQVETAVTQLWLDAFLAQKTIALIQRDQVLFEQMVDITKASYGSAVGTTQQQDVIRSQLELIQLEDRLMVEQQKLESALAQLNQWLYQYDADTLAMQFSTSQHQAVSESLPQFDFRAANLFDADYYNSADLMQVFSRHPAIRAEQIKQQVAEKGVELAKTKYQPQWGVNASYGYRDDAPDGMDRSDFFSIGVSFDLPLFTENRQDQQVAASISRSEAVKTEQLLLFKSMISQTEKEFVTLKRLKQRQTLFSQQIITQTHQQAEAALTAYTNDNGDFAEVVRARIAELNAQISSLQIDVNVLKTIARINYFFTQSTATPAANGDRS